MYKTKYILLSEIIDYVKPHKIPNYDDLTIEQLHQLNMTDIQNLANEELQYFENEYNASKSPDELKVMIVDDDSIDLLKNLAKCDWGEQIEARVMLNISKDEKNQNDIEYYMSEINEIEQAIIETGTYFLDANL